MYAVLGVRMHVVVAMGMYVVRIDMHVVSIGDCLVRVCRWRSAVATSWIRLTRQSRSQRSLRQQSWDLNKGATHFWAHVHVMAL